MTMMTCAQQQRRRGNDRSRRRRRTRSKFSSLSQPLLLLLLVLAAAAMAMTVAATTTTTGVASSTATTAFVPSFRRPPPFHHHQHKHEVGSGNRCGLIGPCTGGGGTAASSSSLVILNDREDPHDGGGGNNNKKKKKTSDTNTDDNKNIIFTSLADTEKWIQRTLNRRGNASTSTSSSSSSSGSTTASSSPATNAADNPYTRKEVSYECDTSTNTILLLSHIFRHLKELRLSGEEHGRIENSIRKSRIAEMNSSPGGGAYRPGTHRQTLVVVVPTCHECQNNFVVFDNLIRGVNEARRQSRDYVTDVSLEESKKYRAPYGEDGEDWITMVSLAHLHPKFGTGTAAEQEETAAAEAVVVDPREEEYKLRKLEARRSPHPTIVLEVKSVPPPPPEELEEQQRQQGQQRDGDMSGDGGDGDYRRSKQQQGRPPATRRSNNPNVPKAESDPTVSRDDVARLEALFGQSSSTKPKQSSSSSDDEDEEEEYIAKQFTHFLNPLGLTQNWIADHDPLYQKETSTFVASTGPSGVRHSDEAYEFVLNQVANSMMLVTRQWESLPNSKRREARSRRRDYLLLSNFVSKSATSFERFANQLQELLDLTPELKNVGNNSSTTKNGGTAGVRLNVSTFHGEHVDEDRRSPVPVLVLEWTAVELNDISKWHG